MHVRIEKHFQKRSLKKRFDVCVSISRHAYVAMIPTEKGVPRRVDQFCSGITSFRAVYDGL